jgi:hypothetical protein
MVQSNEDANEHADSIRAMNRRPWSKERIENHQLLEKTADLMVENRELREELARIMREFSAYRLEHPIR